MFTWKVEELKLKNEKSILYIGKERIFNCESELTREEKIAFVDSMQNGKLSYILELVDKFNKDKSTLPKDAYGNIKTISLKAWIKRNDIKYGNTNYTRIIDSWYRYGRVYLLGCERWITWNDFENGKANYDTYANYVDEIFHRQLKQCLKMEDEYFRAHDEYEILKDKFRNKNYSTTFGVHIGMCSNGCIYVYDDNNDNDKKREITIDELKYLLSKYEELDALVEKITKEIEIKY